MIRSARHELLVNAAARFPKKVAIEVPGEGTVTYAELDLLSDRVRDRPRCLGVSPEDRVGLCLRTSIDAVAAIFGILKSGAAYVPIDPNAPASRGAYILNNCAIRAAVVEARLATKLT